MTSWVGEADTPTLEQSMPLGGHPPIKGAPSGAPPSAVETLDSPVQSDRV
jgi:hypothetical protein